MTWAEIIQLQTKFEAWLVFCVRFFKGHIGNIGKIISTVCEKFSIQIFLYWLKYVALEISRARHDRRFQLYSKMTYLKLDQLLLLWDSEFEFFESSQTFESWGLVVQVTASEFGILINFRGQHHPNWKYCFLKRYL